ncbi:MAG: hypothetical protein H0V45_03550 [Actinobacteria bacterium]|nr:hypothetical protein [Actinomycetota bacterium]
MTATVQLTPIATYQAQVAVADMFGGERSIDYSLIPNTIFTDPELAAVGLTEAEAREQGLLRRRAHDGVGGRSAAGPDRGARRLRRLPRPRRRPQGSLLREGSCTQARDRAGNGLPLPGPRRPGGRAR